MLDDFPLPLRLHDEPGPRWTVKDVARMMAEPGAPTDFCAGQLRRFAQDRLVETRGHKGTGRTAHRQFAASDAAVAKILSILVSEHLVADPNILSAVSLACYSWQLPEQAKRSSSPINNAIADSLEQNDLWVLRYEVLRHDQSGQRRIRAFLYNAADLPATRIDGENPWMPRGTTTLLLPLILRRLFANREAAN